ncbi:MAG: hypothetical protein Q4G65_07195 [bacterium]|nr:hypothetical protein [bacterium]
MISRLKSFACLGALAALGAGAHGQGVPEPVDGVRSDYRNYVHVRNYANVATNAAQAGIGNGFAGRQTVPTFRTSIGVPISAQAANLQLGEKVDPPANWNGAAPSITADTGGSVVWVDYAKTVIAIDAGPVEIRWPLSTGGTHQQVGVVSAAPSKRPVRLYWTHERPTSTSDTTYAALQNAGPTVSFGSNYRVDLHGTSSVKVWDPKSGTVGGVRLKGNELQAFKDTRGTFLITYSRLDEAQNQRVLLAYELVTVLEPTQTQIDVKVGEQLKPITRAFDTDALFPKITRGLTDDADNGEVYVYQHQAEGAQKNFIWAIRDSSEDPWKIEIFWRAKEELDVVWPFEVDIYAASWDRAGAQVYTRVCEKDSGGKAEVNPKVFVPPSISVTAMDYQIPKKHIVTEPGAFYSNYADGDTFALLKYSTGENVWFQTVRSVSHRDTSLLAELGLDIGTVSTNRTWWTGASDEEPSSVHALDVAWLAEEIRAPFAGGEGFFYPGWIHRATNTTHAAGVLNPYNTDVYAYPTAYVATNSLYAPIFPVNIGELEVWWALPSALNGEQDPTTGHVGPLTAPIYFPSVPVTYQIEPPTEKYFWDNGVPQIVVSSGKGSAGYALNDTDPWVASPTLAFLPSYLGDAECLLASALSCGGEFQSATNFTVEARLSLFTYNYETNRVEIPWATFCPRGGGEPLLRLGFDACANLYVDGTNVTDFSRIPAMMYTNRSEDKPNAEFHLAVTHDEKGEFIYYVNGMRVAAFTPTNKLHALNFSAGLLRLFEANPELQGEDWLYSSATFSGYMSGFRVWATTRTWQEIFENRYLEVPANSKLVVQYGEQRPPDDGQEHDQWPISGSVQDSSDFGNHARPGYDRAVLGDLVQAGEFAQAPLKPHSGSLVGANAEIYRQNDRKKDGYNPNEEHALIIDGVVHALRTDLNVVADTVVTNEQGETTRKFTSLPYVLVQFPDEDRPGRIGMQAFRVVPENDMYHFGTFLDAGHMIQAPDPIARLQPANLHKFIDGPRALSKALRAKFNGYTTLASIAEVTGVSATNEVLQALVGVQLSESEIKALETSTCFKDRKGWYWAQQAGNDGGVTNYVFEFSYPSQPSFDFPDGVDAVKVGETVAWMKNYRQRDDSWMGEPTQFMRRSTNDVDGINYTFIVKWPDSVPELFVNETLYDAKNGLPAIHNQLSVKIAYEQSDMVANKPSVQLIDPTVIQYGSMTNIPDEVNWYERSSTGLRHFSDLPPYLRNRYVWNGYGAFDLAHGNTHEIELSGKYIDEAGVDNYLWLNVLDPRAKKLMLNEKLFPGASDAEWVKGVNSVSTNVVAVNDDVSPFDTLALTTTGKGSGYVTLVMNDSTNRDLVPSSENVFMYVIKVVPELYNGTLHPILSSNPLDKQQNMKYTADFGGHPELWEFEWSYANPRADGSAPAMDSANWNHLGETSGSDLPMLDWVTVGDEGVFGLSDHYIRCRYRALDPEVQALVGTNWTAWTKGAYAEGWIKRVLKAVNPFEQRYMSYLENAQDHELNTQLSMIQQAGAPYDGDVPLNEEALDQYGLIQIYETVLNQAKKLSIDGNHDALGSLALSLQMAAGRIAELYMVLGNEALADAMNPTVDLGGDSRVDSGAESSIFPFMNQCENLLDEELCLLRGRDCAEDYFYAKQNTVEPWYAPTYNRLTWNLSSDIMGGQVAYMLNYGINDLKGDKDGQLDVSDAQALYPQGHGDAYGHYLSAVKGYYSLLRHPNFGWPTQIEGVLAYGGSAQITCSYFHEKRFALAASAKARTAEMIVSRTARQAYEAGEDDPWMHAEDTLTSQDDKRPTAEREVIRHWGVDEWATRGHLGAYYDWLVANAILPAANAAESGLLQMIDRESTLEIGEIATYAKRIQQDVDAADSGMNPLGLSESTVPFDISPSEIDEGKTHFEQVYARALRATQVAHDVFKRIKKSANALRDQNEERDFERMVDDEEAAINRKLVEIYGTPYMEDIGPGKLYPQGYSGPDLHHYYYVETYDIDGSNTNANKGRYISCVVDNYKLVTTNCTGTYEAEIDKSVEDYGALGNLVSGALTLYNTGLSALGKELNPWLKYGGVTVEDTLKLPVELIDTGADHLDGKVDYTFAVAAWSNAPYNASYFVGIDGYTVKPWQYTSQRRAEGALQIALTGYGDKFAAIEAEQANCKKITVEIRGLIEELNSKDYKTQMDYVIEAATNEVNNYYAAVAKNAETIAKVLEQSKDLKRLITESISEGLPKVTGLSFDLSSLGRAAAYLAQEGLEALTNNQIKEQEEVIEQVKSETEKMQEELKKQYDAYMGNEERQKKIAEIQAKAAELTAAISKLESAMNVANEQRMSYAKLLEEGRQLQAERTRLRVAWSSDLSTRRYRNMFYQILRNDELQRYNEAFEAAAKYTYLAAKAYDYETGLLQSDSSNAAGREFMSQIVKSRALGRFSEYDDPLGGGSTGDPGLADILFRMNENWQVLKGRLGFNNPQNETDGFSLRRELFRKNVDDDGDDAWKQLLQGCWCDNLRTHPAFARLAQPFDPMETREPGFAIPFRTVVAARYGFFGNNLEPGDNAFSSTYFATKIRGVGIWLEGEKGRVANRPEVYLIPAGLDYMRVPVKSSSSAASEIRAWDVVDQTLPIPYPLSESQWETTDWSMFKNVFGNEFCAQRRHPTIRASVAPTFEESAMSYNARLIGRSVWNDQWWLIIPAASLHSDNATARENFVNAVRDIHLFLKTYSFSGN